jgi:hypothetical protein
MNPHVGKLAFGAAILVFSALLSVLLPAQDASAALMARSLASRVQPFPTPKFP